MTGVIYRDRRDDLGETRRKAGAAGRMSGASPGTDMSNETIRILVVDDDANLRKFLTKELAACGMSVDSAGSGDAAIEKVRRFEYDVVLLDVVMPGMDGLSALRGIRGTEPAPEVIILTGQGTVDSAVRAMRSGAFDYLSKPFHLDALEVHIQKAYEQGLLARRARAFERLLTGDHPDLVGESPALERVKDLIRRVAGADTSVVIEGESGTGKELVARAVHAGSPRAGSPFVVVNCGALQESLLESELFGHEQGAFTGAVRAREGLAEVAHGGTLFLDEVGELDLGMQVKLLRFLESGEIRRVGSDQIRRVNLRVVAATNRRLADEVRAGNFREDLYYRLRVFAIEVPPLRARLEDVPLLAAHFLATIRGPGPGPYRVDPEVLDALRNYSWPGNIRELRNTVERMMLLADKSRITTACLPPEILDPAGSSPPLGDDLNLARLEHNAIDRALRECNGRRAEAAERLGISVRTLYNRLSEYAKARESLEEDH
jgi:DNA-binding NtrC family response regulator